MSRTLRLEVLDRRYPAGSETPIHPAVQAIESIAQALHHYRCSETRIRFGKLVLLLSDLAALHFAFVFAAILAAIIAGESKLHRIALLSTDGGALRATTFGFVACALALWFWVGVNHYTNRRPIWNELREIVVALSVGFIVDAALSFLSKNPLSRVWLAGTWMMTLILLPAMRFSAKALLLRLGWLYQPYVLVGNCSQVLETIRALESESLMGFRLVAVLTTEKTVQSPFNPESCRYAGKSIPVFTVTKALEDFISTPSHLRVVFVLGEHGNGPLKSLAQRVALRRDDVYLVPAIVGLPLYGMEMYNFFSHEVLLLRARNNLNRRGVRTIKRLFDIVASASLLVLIAPLLAVVALRIRTESGGSGGSIVFTQHRVGYDGSTFPIFKFRSMVPDADKVLDDWKTANPELWQQYVQSNFKLAEDPRVTRVGRWIRRTSIDELPQLFNVLRGDMSLVGPRPLLPRELEHYGADIDVYHNVRPGITGLWQVSGRSNTSFAHRVAMDRWYIRNWALWLDLVILIKTIRVVFAAEGAK